MKDPGRQPIQIYRNPDNTLASGLAYRDEIIQDFKELDEEGGLDWYYFGARYFDPVIGRFLSVDPMVDKYPFHTPYNYALNSPLNVVDPDGRDAQVIVNQGDSTISVSTTIYIYGSGANDNIANRMQQNINKAWNEGMYTDPNTGITYTVNINVTVSYVGQSAPLSSLFGSFNSSNYIEIPTVIKTSFVYNDGYTGKWRGNTPDPSPHEFGHLVGLDDRYSISGSFTGWAGNIMAESAMREPINNFV